MDNITAKVSCFARAYHYKNNDSWVFRDDYAEKMLTKEEYDSISSSMIQGISFFKPGFTGTKEEALDFIVENNLAPSVLARSAFCENRLFNAIMLGCSQYIVFASGYDTFLLRNKKDNLKVFELDQESLMEDKIKRIKELGFNKTITDSLISCDLSKNDWYIKLIDNGFDKTKIVFGSLLGITYYLEKKDFSNLLKIINQCFVNGSSICFDFPLKEDEVNKVEELAKGANEEMKAKYTYNEIEKILEENNFLIYEYLSAEEAKKAFFLSYNKNNPQKQMNPPKAVGYILAVKK